MMEWQPIETAPKDGTRILLFEDGDCGGAITGSFDQDLVGDDFLSPWWDVSGASELFPTHWMPLPEPPDEEMGRRGIDITEVILQGWKPMPEDWMLRAKLKKLTERVHEPEQQVEKKRTQREVHEEAWREVWRQRPDLKGAE